MLKILGIGEYTISRNRGDTLKTYSLGSCVAITMHCPVRQVSGMAHIALPIPLTVNDGQQRPAYYAETAIPLMLTEMAYTYGCYPKDLILGMYGGTLSVRAHDAFKIGLRNVQMIKEIIANNGLKMLEHDTGGYCSRTVEMDVATGKVKIDAQPMII